MVVDDGSTPCSDGPGLRNGERMSASDFDMELQELQERSVGRLLMADVFDKPAFDALLNCLCRKAEIIKMEHVVSKQVLSCLLSASGAIESRAEYDEEVRRHAPLANEFSTLLELIALGEDCSDRNRGVPRVL